MNIQNINVKDIKPYPNNAKKHPKTQIDNVAQSIDKFGFVQPIVLSKDNVVVIGHCRLLAAKQLKLAEVPCLYVDDLTDEQIQMLRNLDNKLNESEWDFDLLKDDIDGLDFSDFDIDWGFGEEEETTKIVEDEAPDVDDVEPIAKLGDIWQLGRHRLMCGDSTSIDDVEKLMGGAVGRHAPYRPSV